MAAAIHSLSHRRDQPFIALNCAGLGDELATSQLFGHRRGACTGAVDDQIGLFEAAGAGTLFLDEIGELSLRVQTMLLRALEEHRIMRLGEAKTREVRARILTATNRDLTAEAAAGRFRADLLYRIRVARIQLPPLVHRREDIPLLARSFLAEHAATLGKHIWEIDDEALSVLMQYDWPGNVRELRDAESNTPSSAIRSHADRGRPAGRNPRCHPHRHPAQQPLGRRPRRAARRAENARAETARKQPSC